ncbi:MAG TPA: maleylpyruvate isomerase family mycothiol-dependent enzyme [Acidimicrobiales bacterium]|nr:maleylpyruvate isomerase family mycothiol-dependent enzyme [Acidimicrobiales bacterium]
MESPYLPRINVATSKLLVTVSALDDVAVAEPSLLPGWDRAMVITHLAANAEGLRRVVEAAGRGEVAEFYPGGAPAREADIQSGRGRPASQLEERLRKACSAAATALEVARDEVWQAVAVHISGEVRIGPGPVVGRLREVEIHHVDLGCAYSSQDWPLPWVTEEMDRAMLALPSRLPAGTAVYLSATDTGQHWVAGSGDAVELAGPTAELFAWVTGRASSVADQPGPELTPYR